MSGVFVEVRVIEVVSVKEGVNVGVNVFVGVREGVSVDVLVGVNDGVKDGVTVSVGVYVSVGLSVRVGARVDVRGGLNKDGLKNTNSPTKINIPIPITPIAPQVINRLQPLPELLLPVLMEGGRPGSPPRLCCVTAIPA
jgi:hypothetical protein